jgi:hypothetical protein
MEGKMARSHRRKGATSLPELWVPIPWGLFDEIPQISEEAKERAARELSVARSVQRPLGQELDKITRQYWHERHIAHAPPEVWYADQVKPVLGATKALREAIAKLPLKVRLALEHRMSRELHPGLLVGDDAVVFRTLAELDRACQRLMVQGRPGAPSKAYTPNAVRPIIAIWTRYKGKFPLNLTSAPGKSGQDEFTSPGAQFVFQIMRAIDPAITLSEVAGGIRSASKNRSNVRKMHSQ